MSRGASPEGAPFGTAIALRTQAQHFLRLALNSDDRIVQKKHLSSAREVLAEMEVAIGKARVENLAKASADLDLKRENDSESDAESDINSVGREREEDEDNELLDQEGDNENEEDQQWGEDADQASSEEEEWDINNGENTNTPPTTEDPFLIHYFTNGPGKGKPDLTDMKYTTAGQGVNMPIPQNPATNNLDVRVYARLMELFEIESRRRLSLCNELSREKAAREGLAGFNMSTDVSKLQENSNNNRN
jgi:hypothetical protein